MFYARGVDEKAKEQKYEFNIILDKTKPELINMESMDGSINADIAENGSGVSKALIEVYDKDGNLESKNYMDYSEKIVKLSEKKAQMSDFIYRISKRDFLKYIQTVNDIIGNIVYIEDGERYIYKERLNYKDENDEFGDMI